MLTNAAGGIRAGLRPGQPVLISDQLNLTGRSPLTALPPGGAGGRPLFTDLSDVYSARLRAAARAAEPSLAEGVYAALTGPQYETPAEIRMLRTMGADLVGMSTVLEAIAARHLGAEVLGLSLVTNVAAGLSEQKLDHQDVLAAGRDAAGGPRRAARLDPGGGGLAMDADLRTRAAAWMAADPDERDRAELAGLLADDSPEAAADLADRFDGRLKFGTAGLRGAVGAGPNRMNLATVTAATAALARWLPARDPDATR